MSAETVRGEQKQVAQALEQSRGEAGTEKGKGSPAGAAPEPILKEWIELLVRAAFWALVIYQFVFQVSVVNGSSMEPNIHHGDRLLIDKLVYRVRSPKLGEAIVFEAVVTGDRGRRVTRDYIKRVIAGPGDVVKIYGGRVYVNGQELDESAWGPGEFASWNMPHDESAAATYVVPEHRYFVLGDHRSDSEDSRGPKIGFVHEAQIKGKVRWRFWPFGQMNWY
ncbi:MAG: signal peptidase I [Planctomycetota bacterium]|nr:signal peptidase I [Planctomycetota bacterium]